ncbi:Uncharacterized protein TPAR_01461 [Tolypocladium paradoxum]|uniref:Isotrichodermin C-15 hydroxylase n=1 Tax=Tolypocladium paradoxum TaxID=94208 RepID=A0A2S4L798_9HYPO|nr:Uncharacterized protein TPAR_01461 [Tolypocladium paradoxum]
MERVTNALAIAATYVLLRLTYNVCLHPLRRFPGPLANRATVLPKLSDLLGGTLPYRVAEMHALHGPVVRIAPNELAFTDPRAWRDIYARKPGEHRAELPHDMAFYNASGHQPASLIASAREQHDPVRRLLGPGFSERAVKAQEDVIGGHVALLMRRLRENCAGGSVAVDMRDWIAFCAFDLIGNLAFGSDFGCLRDSAYHPWIALILASLRDMVMLQVLRALGILRGALFAMRALGVGDKALQMHVELSDSKTRQRMELGTGRDDFLDGLIAAGMGFEQLKENGSVLIIAGSETTATLLTGAIFLLTTHRDALDRLTKEVRGEFDNEDDITLSSVNRLTYMLAVLKESLRCYPPIAIAAPRVVPPGGASIAGYTVPQGTVVGVWHWAMYHDATLFTDPYRFDPERWIQPGSNKYANDRLDAVNAFLLGPRNCIGQNLAYAEMRLVLARLVWGFDMRIGEASVGWLEGQRNYLMWEKPELRVHLRPVR